MCSWWLLHPKQGSVHNVTGHQQWPQHASCVPVPAASQLNRTAFRQSASWQSWPVGLCQLSTDTRPGTPCSHTRPLLHVASASHAAADSLHKLQQARWRSAQSPASQPASLSSEPPQPAPPSTTPRQAPHDCRSTPLPGTSCLPARLQTQGTGQGIKLHAHILHVPVSRAS